MPLNAPKVDVQLPNMVQWATAAPPKPQLQLSPAAAAPKLKERAVRDIAVPEVANNEKNAGALYRGGASGEFPAPDADDSMTAVAQQRQTHTDSAAAPEIALRERPQPASADRAIGNTGSACSASERPAGKSCGAYFNLPGGKGVRHSGSSAWRIANGASKAGAAATAGTTGAGAVAGNANSLPAAISVSGGNSRPGGIAAGGIAQGRLNLKTAAPDLAAPSRRGSSMARAIDPNVPPGKILSGKEVYTLDVNLPNLTSVAGSWVLNFRAAG